MPPPDTTARPTIGLAVAAVGAVLWMLLLPLPAEAHAALESSSPAAGDHVAELPRTVTLTFDEDVFTPAFVTVTGPDGTNYASGKPTVDGAKVSQAVSPASASGAFTTAYRVVSDDGHPVTGTIRFTVGAGKAAAAGDGSSQSFWERNKVAIIGVAIILIAAAGALIATAARTGSRDPAGR